MGKVTNDEDTAPDRTKRGREEKDRDRKRKDRLLSVSPGRGEPDGKFMNTSQSLTLEFFTLETKLISLLRETY